VDAASSTAASSSLGTLNKRFPLFELSCYTRHKVLGVYVVLDTVY